MSSNTEKFFGRKSIFGIVKKKKIIKEISGIKQQSKHETKYMIRRYEIKHGKLLNKSVNNLNKHEYLSPKYQSVFIVIPLNLDDVEF